MRAAHIAHVFCLRPIKFSIYSVVIAVSVVDAKAPCCFEEEDTDLFINVSARAARLFFLTRPAKFF